MLNERQNEMKNKYKIERIHVYAKVSQPSCKNFLWVAKDTCGLTLSC